MCLTVAERDHRRVAGRPRIACRLHASRIVERSQLTGGGKVVRLIRLSVARIDLEPSARRRARALHVQAQPRADTDERRPHRERRGFNESGVFRRCGAATAVRDEKDREHDRDRRTESAFD